MISITAQHQQPISGTITGRDGSIYLVRTASGRTIRASAAETWIIGTPVTVLSGQIVGIAGRPQTATVYEV